MFESPRRISDTIKKVKQKVERVPMAAADAFFDHEENPAAPAPWERLVAPDIPQLERTRVLFAILRDAVPDALFKKLTGQRYEYQGDVLPIDPERYQFESRKVGDGGECNVYKLTALDPDQPSFVIKIDRFTAEKSVDVLVARGKQIREEYEEEQKWYQDIPDLIPAELQFIAKNPRGGGRALFTIQEYYGTAEEIHDLFRGYSEDALVDILRADPKLALTFKTFATLTLERAEQDGQIIDTLGDKNVILVDRPSGEREIRILDPHAMKNLHQEKYRGETARIKADMQFLRDVSAALDR